MVRKIYRKVEIIQGTLEGSVEYSASEVNGETAQVGKITMVDEGVSQSYDNDENSPDVMNVVPAKDQAKKRKALEQEVSETQARKKIKTPEKVQPAIVLPEPDATTSSASVVVKKPTKAKKVDKPKEPAPSKPVAKKERKAKVVSQEGDDAAPKVSKKVAAKKARTPKVKVHDVSAKGDKTIKEMVFEAINAIEHKSRKGVSFAAVKVYIKAKLHYDKIGLVKNVVSKLIATGELVKTTGIGLSGSFKLPKQQAPKKKRVFKRQTKSAPAKAN